MHLILVSRSHAALPRTGTLFLRGAPGVRGSTKGKNLDVVHTTRGVTGWRWAGPRCAKFLSSTPSASWRFREIVHREQTMASVWKRCERGGHPRLIPSCRKNRGVVECQRTRRRAVCSLASYLCAGRCVFSTRGSPCEPPTAQRDARKNCRAGFRAAVRDLRLGAPCPPSSARWSRCFARTGTATVTEPGAAMTHLAICLICWELATARGCLNCGVSKRCRVKQTLQGAAAAPPHAPPTSTVSGMPKTYAFTVASRCGRQTQQGVPHRHRRGAHARAGRRGVANGRRMYRNGRSATFFFAWPPLCGPVCPRRGGVEGGPRGQAAPSAAARPGFGLPGVPADLNETGARWSGPWWGCPRPRRRGMPARRPLPLLP